MKRPLLAALVAFSLSACHEPAAAPRGGIDSVAVVVTGGDEPLPFDPRRGRITLAAGQLAELVGHPVVLELDMALSPDLVARLEESVLASFENVTRELALLKRDVPEVFAAARKIERIRCRYDAIAEAPSASLAGNVLEVKTPPERFPLVARGLVEDALADAHSAALARRWAKVEPETLPPEDRGAWFAYMTRTRPGSGYLWIAARSGGRSTPADRAAHLERILRLAAIVPAGSPLGHEIAAWLLAEGSWVGAASDAATAPARAAYEAWLARSAAALDDAQKLALARLLFAPGEPLRFPGFDRSAFGLAVYDGWVADGAPVPVRAGPRGALQQQVLCPSERRGDRETGLRLPSCAFAGQMLADERARAVLADRIRTKRDTRLLEVILLETPSASRRRDEPARRTGVDDALTLLEQLRDPALYHHGFRVLFDDLARRDDVVSALENAALAWWRSMPERRGMALLVLARRNDHLESADAQWERLAPELGGPVSGDDLARFFAEGPRAAEMAPRAWKGLRRGPERDALVARAMPPLLDRDATDRTSRALSPLRLLRQRYCAERNEAGFAALRTELQRWASQHPAEARSVTNAIDDAFVGRCVSASSDDR